MIRRPQHLVRATAATLAVAASSLLLPALLGWVAAAAQQPPVGVVTTRTIDPSVVLGASSPLPVDDPSHDDVSVIEPPIRTDMVTANWQGSARSLVIRARGADDSWSQWTALPAAEEERPDPTTDEGERVDDLARSGRGGRLSAPVWLGDATLLQVAVRDGVVTRLELTYVNSTGTATASDRLATTLKQTAADVLGEGGMGDEVASALTAQPLIVSRSGWGADESRVRDEPSYASSLRAGVVHHTVTANSYSAAQAPAIVRGIFLSHLGNGWDDIGYNFLVDRYGTIYEGRGGGITENVIGAHALGFNTGTTGVALIGDFSGSGPTAAQQASLRRILSWRLDVGHVHPVRRRLLTSVADDNAKYPAGSRVSLPGTFGHRDVFQTACPGNGAYGSMGDLRRAVWHMGGPKIAEPRLVLRTRADETVGRLTVRAYGNRRMRWVVSLTRRDTGALVRRLTQTASNLEVAWQGDGIGDRQPAWNLDVSIEATRRGLAARPFTRRVGTAPPPPINLTYVGRTPGLVSPNGDSFNDTQNIQFRSNVAGTATVELLSPEEAVLGTLVSSLPIQAGRATYSWNGMAGGALVADGQYRLRISAADSRANTDTVVTPTFSVDDVLGLHPVPRWISPNDDGDRDSLTELLKVTGIAASARLELQRADGTVIETVVDEPLTDTERTAIVSATSPAGVPLADGTYRFHATAVDAFTTSTVVRRFTIDRTKPRGSASRRSSGRLRICSGERGSARIMLRSSAGVRRRTIVLNQRCRTVRGMRHARLVTLSDRAGNRRSVRVRL